MKYVWLLLGTLLGFGLGLGFGPRVRAYFEARELQAERAALDEVGALLSESAALAERRATLLNERVELAGELAEYASFEVLSAEPAALGKLRRLYALEHEIIELDERERWLLAERSELERVRDVLATHVQDEEPVADEDWPALRSTTDAVPPTTEPRPDDRLLRRLFDSLGGA